MTPPTVAVAASRGAKDAARCSACGAGPRTMRDRADLATEWLVPEPGGTVPILLRFCFGCAPGAPIDDVACVRCGDGPLLAGELTAMTLEASLAVDVWLSARGWRLTGPVCPGCVGELSR